MKKRHNVYKSNDPYARNKWGVLTLEAHAERRKISKALLPCFLRLCAEGWSLDQIAHLTANAVDDVSWGVVMNGGDRRNLRKAVLRSLNSRHGDER